MKTIYVVIGVTRKYSDRSEYLIKAYFDEQKAIDHIQKAEQKKDELNLLRPGKYKKLPEDCENEFDPYMPKEDEDQYYYYESVELEEATHED